MVDKNISWGRLLSDLQEIKGIRQDLIAEAFGVTQQYISAIMNGWRRPSDRIGVLILNWATENNLEVNDFSIDETDLDKDIKRLCLKIAKHENKKKIMASLNAIIDTF